MRTVGVICEYNPFHFGHKHQIDLLRAMGYDCIVCVMSGNYTQRGELAIFDKYTRAESAIYSGADLVLELPFPFSSFSAEGFANSGVHILSSLGVNAISFGSECGDLSVLQRTADTITSPEFATVYNDLQKGGLGSAAAYFEAMKRISGNDVSILSNDILGISYVAAIKKQNAKLDVVPIRRDGSAYNETRLFPNRFPSATAIRDTIKNSGVDLKLSLNGYVPKESLSVLSSAQQKGLGPVFANSIYKEIVSFFRLSTPSEIVARAMMRSGGGYHIAEDGCGILERICRVARDTDSFQSLLSSSYNSKYTDARINRVILFSLFGLSDIMTHSMPNYTLLLAASRYGREFLSKIRKSSSIPIVTKPSDADPNSIQRNICEFADLLYTSAMPMKKETDYFIKSHPFMLE